MVERYIDVVDVIGSSPIPPTEFPGWAKAPPREPTLKTKFMEKEKQKPIPLSKDSDAVKKLESSRLVFRSPQNALESGDSVAYEWLEDNVIRKEASVKFGKDATGKDTATIKMINPETKEGRDVYYTANETEVARLKKISKGETVVIDGTETE